MENVGSTKDFIVDYDGTEFIVSKDGMEVARYDTLETAMAWSVNQQIQLEGAEL